MNGSKIWAEAIREVGFWKFPEPAIVELGKAIIEAIDDADPSDEIGRLRASLRHVTDMLAGLLEEEKFPVKGRTNDDRDAYMGWWEDHVTAVTHAYATLAGEDYVSWTNAHPGFYIPPAGEIKL